MTMRSAAPKALVASHAQGCSPSDSGTRRPFAFLISGQCGVRRPGIPAPSVVLTAIFSHRRHAPRASTCHLPVCSSDPGTRDTLTPR